jgi:hypothetical protein
LADFSLQITHTTLYPSVCVDLCTLSLGYTRTYLMTGRQVKVKQPSAGLDHPTRLQEAQVPRISTQSAHEGGKIVSPTHRPPLPAGRHRLYSFLLEAGVDPRATARQETNNTISASTSVPHERPLSKHTASKAMVPSVRVLYLDRATPRRNILVWFSHSHHSGRQPRHQARRAPGTNPADGQSTLRKTAMLSGPDHHRLAMKSLRLSVT